MTLLLKKLTDSVLVLMPDNKYAKALADNKDSLVYKERHLVKIPVPDFEYIKFSSTGCKGDCRAQVFEITVANRLVEFLDSLPDKVQLVESKSTFLIVFWGEFQKE